MNYETILVEQRGAVTLITLNRPQALNALNSQVLADLIAAFGAFDADKSQRCAVLMASASYIAAPSAMRIALPNANLGLAIAPVVAITFPFNVIFGIPIYYQIAIFVRSLVGS